MRLIISNFDLARICVVRTKGSLREGAVATRLKERAFEFQVTLKR